MASIPVWQGTPRQWNHSAIRGILETGIGGRVITTVAYDGKDVACDTLLSEDGHVIPGDRAKKIFQLPDGSLFAGAGDWEEIHLAYDWWLRGRKDPRPELKNFSGLVITTRGADFFEERLRPTPVTSRYISLGSGSRYANTAMELGKTAKQAVAVAMKFDRNTGGQIHVFTPTRIPKRMQRKAVH